MNFVFWGGTGQAKVMRSLIQDLGHDVCAVIDDTPDLLSPFSGVPIFRGRNELEKMFMEVPATRSASYIITIGNPHAIARVELSSILASRGLKPYNAIHPSAIIRSNAQLGTSLQIHPFALVETDVIIGNHCIINSRATVEHECVLAQGVEIGPSATVCGRVSIEENSWIGAGATILPRVKIGKNVIVGAGAVVTDDIQDNEIHVGVPAKLHRRLAQP